MKAIQIFTKIIENIVSIEMVKEIKKTIEIIVKISIMY